MLSRKKTSYTLLEGNALYSFLLPFTHKFCGRCLFVKALLQPVALPVAIDDAGLVGEAVQ